ncbi:class I SAM-dependent methyltransferase [Sphingobium nicotianae]|uniref:Methyltransferase domain-containing protein n=1 Tax=Sphingobium nicotianae TaxID=2782607 RepID=A0A9X1ISW4_9SPHN|nr:methyltransferase domain-containing protein [Sphingobium nicotianae]MBT2188986.1 methyltransferase domain-containing protein [Sphingobium nicotianae]
MSDAQAMPNNTEDWGGEMGRTWLANLERFESMIQPIGAALLTHAQFKPGESVIDIGCGGGATTIAIGRAVSPGGRATGLDISLELIQSCGVRASQGTQSQVCFVCADAATVTVTDAPFDRLFSRFGSMFFADAHAGFRNLRKMVRDGGRIDLSVWAPPEENEWIRTLMGAIGKHVDLPPREPHAPGPFALSDLDYLHDVLTQARFGAIEITPCERSMPVGGAGATPDAAARMLVSTLSIGEAVQAAGPDKRDAVIADLTSALAAHHQPGVGNMLAGKAWIVTATAV